jgi:hypothetical protein
MRSTSSRTGASGTFFDRDGAQTEQPVERVPCVEVLLTMHEVVLGQQHLRADVSHLGEQTGVDRQQPALSDRRGSLKGGYVCRAAVELEGAESRGDRSGRHEDHLGPVRLERCDLPGQGFESLFLGLASCSYERRGSDLDDHPVSGLQLKPRHGPASQTRG